MAVNEATLMNAAVHVGLIDNQAVTLLKKVARHERISLMEAVMREHRLPLSAFYHALAEYRQIPFLQLSQLRLDTQLVTKIPANLALKRCILPVRKDETEIYLVMSDPDDRVALDSVRRVAIGYTVERALADPIALQDIVNRTFGSATLNKKAEEVDSVVLLDDVMKEAYIRRATDIHLEPIEAGMKIRFRIDGHMHDYVKKLSNEEAESIMTRVKVLGSLDISEQRMPQDGGFTYAIMDWLLDEMDIRLATIPSQYGERATMRILGQETKGVSLDQLGMRAETLQGFKTALDQPHGMILVTGPTGSGKSTTLYAALAELDSDRLNILTVEDPVEQVIKGITQVQTGTKITFSSALRSFLRHDPDVILVGEIRDYETADTALKAAMTGHMVLSTLHTNDAVSAITRLHDIGCERYLIASTLTGVIAQRLVRRLCHACRKARPATNEELVILNKETPVEIYDAVGCSHCLGQGYLGRIGLYETLWMDDELSNLIADNADKKTIRTKATALSSIWEDSLFKVISGVTTLSEVIAFRPRGQQY
jgi:type IV pilus assembly protein PilB